MPWRDFPFVPKERKRERERQVKKRKKNSARQARGEGCVRGLYFSLDVSFSTKTSTDFDKEWEGKKKMKDKEKRRRHRNEVEEKIHRSSFERKRNVYVLLLVHDTSLECNVTCVLKIVLECCSHRHLHPLHHPLLTDWVFVLPPLLLLLLLLRVKWNRQEVEEQDRKT